MRSKLKLVPQWTKDRGIEGWEVYWGGRLCGRISPANNYVSYRTDAHFCFKYQGFGIQTEILDYLEKRKVGDIVFVHQGETDKKRYRITLKKFLKKAEFDVLTIENGMQAFVGTNDMEEVFVLKRQARLN